MIAYGSLATWVQLIGEQGIGNRVSGANGVQAATKSQTSVYEVTRPSERVNRFSNGEEIAAGYLGK